MEREPVKNDTSMLRDRLLSESATAQITKLEIANHVYKILELLGVEVDDSTVDTPRRVAKMYYDELFKGLRELPPKIMTQENKMCYDQLILQKKITLKTTCEHHLVPIIGTVAIAYIPDKKLIGLSKMNRIVEYYAKRPQVQEKFTHQVLNHLIDVLGTKDIAVIVDAEHFCIKLRGVEHDDSNTRTSALSGRFRKQELRSELYASV